VLRWVRLQSLAFTTLHRRCDSCQLGVHFRRSFGWMLSVEVSRQTARENGHHVPLSQLPLCRCNECWRMRRVCHGATAYEVSFVCHAYFCLPRTRPMDKKSCSGKTYIRALRLNRSSSRLLHVYLTKLKATSHGDDELVVRSTHCFSSMSQYCAAFVFTIKHFEL